MSLIKSRLKLLVIVIFILSLSIFVTINFSPILYGAAINNFNLNQRVNLSSASIMKCYFFMLKYLQIPWVSHLNLVFFKYSKHGLIHFRDVRHLILFNNGCLLIFGVITYRIIKQDLRMNCMWRLINPLKALITLIIVLMSIAFINFQAFFINFHRVMFRNNDWVFNVHLDPVIKVLPTAFFAWCFAAWLLFFIVMLSLLIHYSK